MPGRNIVGDYRYAYQGQEKDDETGMEAFQLRLWDSRIGRWLSPDPSNQFHSTYMGLGNNPMNGIESNGADWWQLTKDGSLVLVNETIDPFNTFFDAEGLEISRTDISMRYLKSIEGNTGDNHEFIKLRMAQADLIALAVYNDDDVYNKMIQRANETHWKSVAPIKQLRNAGNIPEKKAGSAVIDAFMYLAVLVATKRNSTTGLTLLQQGKVSYKFGGVIEASFDANDMKGLQNRMGNKLYNMQKGFMKNFQHDWNFIQWNLFGINNDNVVKPKSTNCGCKN